MIIIQLNWQKRQFFALTNIYASKHAGACCLHYPAFSEVSKYQIADKLHIMKLAHCCAIFDIFIFIPFPKKSPQNRWIFNFFPLHSPRGVFAGKFHSQHSNSHSRALLLFVHLMYKVNCNCKRMQQQSRGVEKCGKVQQQISSILIHFKIHSHSLYLPQKFSTHFCGEK